MRMANARRQSQIVYEKRSRPTNVTLNASLVDEAKSLGINISIAAGIGLEQAVAKKRAEQWIAANREALKAYNNMLAEHGLPLDRYRLF